jgi:hypothetical protein
MAVEDAEKMKTAARLPCHLWLRRNHNATVGPQKADTVLAGSQLPGYRVPAARTILQ